MKIKLETTQGTLDIEHDSPNIEYLDEIIRKEFDFAKGQGFTVHVNDIQIDPYGDIELKDGDKVTFTEPK